MAASNSVRESQLRREITFHASLAKRDRANALRARPSERAAILASARRHDGHVAALRLQLARLAGSSAPSRQVGEANRLRRIESLRAAIAREEILARQARSVGNRSIESIHAAEAKRHRDTLALLEARDRRVVAPANIPPPAKFVREPPSPALPPGKLAQLRRIDREIDMNLQAAAKYRDRARRAAGAGQMDLVAPAIRNATTMESRARAGMEARRALLYRRGGDPSRGGAETRVGTDAIPMQRGPGDVPMITQAALPTIAAPGAPPAQARPGFQPPRPDTESKVQAPSAEEADPGSEAAAEADVTATAATDTAISPEAGAGGGWTWWIVGGLGALAVIGYAYSKKKGGAAGTRSFHAAPSTPKPNPRRNRRKRHGRNHDRRARRTA